MKTMLDTHQKEKHNITVLPNGWTVHMENGLIHNANGPAVISPFHKEWYQNSRRHNEHGPAVLHKIHTDGRTNYAEWWMQGKLISHAALDEITFLQHWNKYGT